MVKMDAATKTIFRAAAVDTDALTFIPRESIHDSIVSVDAWLDEDQGLLMFVQAEPAAVSRFMYHIGEERNAGVVGIGRGIAAWAINDERVQWLQAKVAEHAEQRSQQ